jgi:predicted SprT family Zn-dependent metalloprotease
LKLDDAEKLANHLLRTHGLRHWAFAFDRALCRFGCCNERKKRITLSAHLTLLNDEGEVRDTILHEIAHALAGVRAGHGPKWKKTALAIGCNGQRCYGKEVLAPKLKFTGTCPTCGHSMQRSRRRRVSCGLCDKKFNPAHIIVWTLSHRDV